MSSSKDDENQKSKSATGANKWQKIAEQAEQTPADLGDSEDILDENADRIEFPSRHQLEDQMTALEMKCEEYKSQLDRTQAELANLHRRSSREVENAHQYGVSKLINALLPVADGLLRGLEGVKDDEHVKNDPKLRAMREGMNLTLNLLHSTLSKFGVTVISPEPGDSFDPQLHEAVSTQESPGAAPNTVLQVLQPGYQLHDRVLRAAMVIVAK